VNPSFTDQLRVSLNEQQFAAVTHGEGPQLVLAGAGSGKTRVITYRIAWLVHELGVDPSSIVAVTFTNKAAAEMRQRTEELLGMSPMTTFVGTFHRFALNLLRAHGDEIGTPRDFVIFDRDDQIKLVKQALAKENLAEASFPPRNLLSAIGGAKNQLLGPSEYEAQAKNFFEQKVAIVYRHYQRGLIQASGVDFDDMLRLSVKLFDRHPELLESYRRRMSYLLVDEFQDTNHAQMRLVQSLAGTGGNLTAVGDEDQGIYRWRGADLSNVLEFERLFEGAPVRKLERNYRSTQNILSAAGAVVEHNEGRIGKKLWTDFGDGELVELYRARDEQDEAQWVVRSLTGMKSSYGLSDMAILVRTNAQTRAFEDELNKRQVPYTLVGGTRFYERTEIKDLVAYLRMLRNPQDGFSLSRVINQPPRGIGKTTLDRLITDATEYGRSAWEVLSHSEFDSYPKRSATSLLAFRDLVVGLRADLETKPLPEVVERIVEKTRYLSLFDDSQREGIAKIENIREFVTAVHEFAERHAELDTDEMLTAFLDHISLVSDIDQWSEEGVALMTLHSAKGLEFAVAVVAGLEEGVLPHFNASDSKDGIEEERRLLYVGMTRAERQLYLTTCRRRRIAGRYQDQTESPFLTEIPGEYLRASESPQLFTPSPRAGGAYAFFDKPRPKTPDFAAEPEDGALGRGRRVRHASLGEGVVLETEGSGDQMKITVFFDGTGKRKLLAKYANLSPA